MKTKISIGIQARSTSNRLPNKVHALIGNKPMICHVVQAARSAANYISKYRSAGPFDCRVFLLIPKNDPVGALVKDYYHDVTIIEGDEHDVLSRYQAMSDQSGGEWIVRITGDCPMIPPYLISKAILEAHARGAAYVSNVYEGMRLSPDGWDCEVMSKRLLSWANDTARGQDREHVTTIMRREPPGWARMAMLHGFLDLSALKISIDTEEDLARVRAQFEKVATSEEQFKRKYGDGDIVRF